MDIIYPPHCIHCQRAGSLLCSNCLATIHAPLPRREPGPLTEQRAIAEFDGAIKEAIHAFKYKSQHRFAEVLGKLLAKELDRAGWNPTLITASPLHKARLQMRGYNQAALLAEQVALSLHLPFRPDAIEKIKETRPQVGLNARERQNNVSGAFQASAELVANQRIVLIDDVYTTGATLRACAEALRSGGAQDVWALTVAQATPQSDFSRDAQVDSPKKGVKQP